jgi:hypothetical protein
MRARSTRSIVARCCGLLDQHLAQQVGEWRREPLGARRDKLSVEHVGDVAERKVGHHHRVEHHAETPDVRRQRIGHRAAQHLGRRVRRRADAHLQVGRVARLDHRDRQPKVDQHHAPVAVGQNVLVLEVAVRDAVGVAVLHGGGELRKSTRASLSASPPRDTISLKSSPPDTYSSTSAVPPLAASPSITSNKFTTCG